MSRLIDADALEPDADYDDGEFWAYSLAQVRNAPTIHQEPARQEIIRCKNCKFYTPMNRETKTGICRLLMHQNFGDDWYCAGAERRTDGR